jgi:hypothetical protein
MGEAAARDGAAELELRTSIMVGHSCLVLQGKRREKLAKPLLANGAELAVSIESTCLCLFSLDLKMTNQNTASGNIWKDVPNGPSLSIANEQTPKSPDKARRS